MNAFSSNCTDACHGGCGKTAQRSFRCANRFCRREYYLCAGPCGDRYAPHNECPAGYGCSIDAKISVAK